MRSIKLIAQYYKAERKNKKDTQLKLKLGHDQQISADFCQKLHPIKNSRIVHIPLSNSAGPDINTYESSESEKTV